MITHLSSLQGLSTDIRSQIGEILNKISEFKTTDQADDEGDVNMAESELFQSQFLNQIRSGIDSKNSILPSQRSLQSLSKNTKSHHIDMANIKLKYEDQLEDKNERIRKLESRNKQYLAIIAHKDATINESEKK